MSKQGAQIGHTLRALIVDDHPAMQVVLEQFIRSCGHDVVGVAGNGKEAVEKFQELTPDFIIMDLSMPVMNGMEASRQILEERPVPIILCSVGMTDAIASLAKKAGVRTCLGKPFTAEEIEAEVRSIEQEYTLGSS